MDENCGDYLELNDVRPGTDVLSVVMDRCELGRNMERSDGFPVLTLEPGVEMFVDEHAPDRAVLAIAGPAAQRRAAAGRIYRILAERTDWTLVWTADDASLVVSTGGAPAPLLLAR